MTDKPSIRTKNSRQFYRQVNNLMMQFRASEIERIFVEQHPFRNYQDLDEDELPISGSVILLIYPQAPRFDKQSIRLELKISSSYPITPPDVFFLTPINHPDIDENNKLSSETLKKITSYSEKTSLTDLVKAVNKHLEVVDVETPTNSYFNNEYLTGTVEVDFMILDSVDKCALTSF